MISFKHNFFLIKCITENRHCPVDSACREFINKRTKCHSVALLKYFSSNTVESHQPIPCHCCYNCIVKDSNSGCAECSDFINRYLPDKRKSKLSKSVASELRDNLEELFSVMNIKYVKVERVLKIDCKSFIKDLLRTMDEIISANDIVRFWHVEFSTASKVFAVIEEVLADDVAEEIDCPADFSDGELDYSTDSASEDDTSSNSSGLEFSDDE